MATKRPIRMRVHEKGHPRLDSVLRLVDSASQARPLGELLGTLCQELAQVMQVQVVSVYVREHDPDSDVDALVMRGNVGFPASAVGNVRLAMGEGITGFVAECLRPVSCAVGSTQENWKPVPGLGEERFPAFLAMPLVSAGHARGVLVFQRREAHAFEANDLLLAAALTAPVAYAIERSGARRDAASATAAPPGSRSARLHGVPLSAGDTLGRVETLPPLALEPSTAIGGERTLSASVAFDQVSRELSRGFARVQPSLDVDARRRMAVLALLFDDQRLRELAMEECNQAGLVPGLRRVAREYARAPYRAGVSAAEGGDWMAERAAEVEDLCLLVSAHARGVRAPSAGGVLIVERLTGCLALAAVARHASALAIAGRVEDGALGAAVLAAANVPAVSEVAELFVWARPGDRVLVDGSNGIVRINPPASAEARLRASGVKEREKERREGKAVAEPATMKIERTTSRRER
jgi:phosphotransferase system, enzyme I, PtsP